MTASKLRDARKSGDRNRASDVNDWAPVSRDVFSDYLTPKGISPHIGLSPEKFVVYTIKELVDNALDATDRLREPSIEIKLQAGKQYTNVRVKSNSTFTVDPEVLVDFTKRTSNKYFAISPSRGQFGSALQFLMCIASHHSSLNGKNAGHLRIRSNNREYTFTNVHLECGVPKPEKTIRKLNDSDLSEVECTLFGDWDYNEASDMVLQFIAINPHVNFIFNKEAYDRVSSLTLMKQSSIHFYKYEEFAELLENYRDEEPHTFLSRFHRLNLRDVLKGLGKTKRMAEVNGKNLFRTMIKSTPIIRAKNLGLLGRAPLERRIEQIFGKIQKSDYVVRRSKDLDEEVPYVVEVLTAVVPELQRSHVWFGINQSVPPDEHNALHNFVIGKESLEHSLKVSGIDEDDPVIVVVHVCMPRMFYPTFSKNATDLPSDILATLFNAVKTASRFYKNYVIQPTAKTDWSRATDEATRWIMAYWNEGTKVGVRQIFYFLAHRLGLIPTNGNGYNYLDRLLVKARRDGTIPWEAIGDRSRYTIFPELGGSAKDVAKQQISDIVSKVGFNPWNENQFWVEVLLEKESLVGVIESITEKLMVPLTPLHGYGGAGYTHQSAESWKSLAEKGKTIMLLHLRDHDPSGEQSSSALKRDLKEAGLDVLDLSNQSLPLNKLKEILSNKNAEGVVVLVELALTDEQVKQYKLPWTRAKERDPRLRDYKKKHRNDKVYELDALDPRDLRSIVEDGIKTFIEPNIWNDVLARNEKEKERAKQISKQMLEYLETPR